MPGAVEGVIFDFDATLGIASHDKPAAHRAMFTRLRAIGLTCEHDEFVRVMDVTLDALNQKRMNTAVEPTFGEYYGEVLTNLGIAPREELVREWRDLLLAHHEFRLYSTTRATLDRLAELGIRMAVVSNTINGTTTFSLARAGLLHRFAAVIQSCDVGIRKPDPRIFQIGLEALEALPAATMCVGNSPYFDITSPRRMGMTTVWMRTELSYREPCSTEDRENVADHAIDHLGELLPILAS